MTIAAERLTTPTHNLVTAYKSEAGEAFELGDLEREFPYLVRRLGVNGLYLADAAANYAGTFKWRGALAKMHELRQLGETTVTVPSAGNHLRGAIIAGRVLGMTVHGVVPQSAPSQKKEGALRLQPDPSMLQLHVEGDTFDESLAWALDHTDEFGPLVHPFDDDTVAAGQGTIADDILDLAALMDVDPRHVVVPVGGGGLLRGIAENLATQAPQITVHGVEAEGSNSLSQSGQASRVVAAEQPNPRYGGSAVRRTGRGTLKAYQTLQNIRLHQAHDADVRDIVDDYEQSIRARDLHRTPGYMPFEPTTLVALTALRQIIQYHPGEAVVVVGTGRNDSLDAVWK